MKCLRENTHKHAVPSVDSRRWIPPRTRSSIVVAVEVAVAIAVAVAVAKAVAVVVVVGR